MSGLDWIDIAEKVLSLVAVFGLPLLAKKNARLATILGAVIQGVEDADHKGTKQAIDTAATMAGVGGHLDSIVQKQTGGAS